MEILIVDDEPTSSALNAAYVRKLANCNAVCFGNACDALDWAATHDPGIVIVDYLMPLMDGAEFTRRLRRLPGKDRVPVVMVTGFDDDDVREIARGVGVNEFLSKPVDRVQLSACILNLSAVRSGAEETNLASIASRQHEAGVDAAELATILAERDRMRALSQTEPTADDDGPLSAEAALSRLSEEILILDDERTSIAMLDHYVRKLKCVPARFTDPQEALEWCETNDPCAVIVDYMMPDVDGLEFTRRFRRLPGKGDIPMLMISAYADAALKQSAHDAGVNQFLHKPVDAADLTAHLRAIIAARAVHRRVAKHERVRGDKVPGHTGRG